MTRLMKRVSHAVFAIVAAAVLTFGAQTAYASTSTICTGGPGFVGYCPPLDAQSCDDRCDEIFGTFGNQCLAGYCCCAV